VASYGKTLVWDRPFVAAGGGPATGGAYAIEPHVAERVFDEMARETGVEVLRGARLSAVRKDGARIRGITMEDGTVVRAKIFIDATYEGDLMAKAGVSYTLQREGNAKYGETYNGIHYSEKYLARTNHLQPGPHGRVPGGQGVWDRDFPLDPWIVPGRPESGLLPLLNPGEPGTPGEPAPGVQAYCYRLCLTTDPTNRMPVARPADYDPKRYELVARFIAACLAIGDDMDLRWFSKHDPLPNAKWDFNTATFGANLPGASWEWPEATYARRAEIAQAHEDHMRGLLHFLATDPRVPAKVRDDVKRFGLPRDEFPDSGGWPHQLYVREARRMVSDLVMTEHHTFGRRVAEDSVGLGSYGTDTHEIRRIVKDGVVQREGKTATGRDGAPPYPVGYGAIVPKAAECDNLLVTFALSASHTAFSSIRMEPVLMILSQSAATAACLAIDDGVAVQQVDRRRLRERLLKDGQILEWAPVAATVGRGNAHGDASPPGPAVPATEGGPAQRMTASGPASADVFVHEGKDWYRIPSLAVAADGTVLAFASRRKGSLGDFGHETDVVLRRSADGGRTFGPMQTLASRPGTDIHHGPALVDRRNGRLFKFCRFWPATNEAKKVVSGTPYGRMKELGWIDHVVTSDDHGVTWSAPRAVPLDFPSGATSAATGNGVHGIQLADGRLLVPGGCVVDGRRQLCLFASDDGGKSWATTVVPAPDDGGLREFGLAEVADGSLYFNIRSRSGHRWTSRSAARGDAFGPFAMDPALPDPDCHGGLVRLGGVPGDRLAFSNPATPRGRHNLTIRTSADGGRTWPVAMAIHEGPAAYSDLAALSDGTILCLFECGSKMAHERIALSRVGAVAAGH
jgi:hypothetical protein